MTVNLKIISDSRIRYIVSKGPKYRFPSRIDLKKCREEIASALNDFGIRWCKREYVEPNVLKEWNVSIFKIMDQRITFHSQNTNLLPLKPKSTFRLGTVSIKILGGLNQFYGYPTSPSASIMAQNI